ncbi:methylated-DNA--[protein]-cysteine S-methyltransferase [Acetobacter sp. AN02]|uniref:methylated-DNA--[protein]-cysteine S-methyltransferase n=1 Tax=Acetobacter sp. AN02 TaxID=2894186 RepID=UPI0024346092|nr:methylated-DNA--[protein]-cysteine S-methyltransferase [Acetobacter sp. AN02]MDG6094897.1 methylated-DNA--[protein]-cysteine S-methyltransferase [Acetobacter sp. AN02]
MPQLSMHSPLGSLTLTEEDGALISLDWGRGRDQENTPFLEQACAWLDAWFDHPGGVFPLPMRPHGTVYQRRVWDVLLTIPCGQTLTYGEVASLVGGSPRSVGGAVGSNPIPILIPCHRVLGAKGLGGFSSDGGVDDKRWLLELERGETGGVQSCLPVS